MCTHYSNYTHNFLLYLYISGHKVRQIADTHQHLHNRKYPSTNKLITSNSNLPTVQWSPLQPGAHVHVLGAEQVPPLEQSTSQIAVYKCSLNTT